MVGRVIVFQAEQFGKLRYTNLLVDWKLTE
jgi:hypothetical protein